MCERNNIMVDFRTAKGFEELYNCTSDQLFTIIFRQVGDKSTTQELVQNIYLKLWERRFDIELEIPIQHYLNRAAKLAALDYLKTAQRRQQHLDEISQEQNQANNDTERTVFFQELKNRISAIADQLPPKCKAVFMMSREQGLNIREISEELAIAEKTVEAHLTKALKTIKGGLDEKV
ncbi:RNA polymerase sigma-70 factor [Sphingobacterium yanglingense]|uniref:RNA polymerase sigma-70 factor (ECF subfamily) n=1 Tax=Sphingobacterium yanglingense TaxID=1437280 RepID=A0A4R6WKJ7_9SPHI|nr:RNA polymerase sigma-70 factor [Sphingobacterium yanglingense]TDQ76321.1 RNA polymerase sigma-70 factor (ECF subfamily) [Sphingobacterium yanglingense]